MTRADKLAFSFSSIETGSANGGIAELLGGGVKRRLHGFPSFGCLHASEHFIELGL